MDTIINLHPTRISLAFRFTTAFGPLAKIDSIIQCRPVGVAKDPIDNTNDGMLSNRPPHEISAILQALGGSKITSTLSDNFVSATYTPSAKRCDANGCNSFFPDCFRIINSEIMTDAELTKAGIVKSDRTCCDKIAKDIFQYCTNLQKAYAHIR